MERLAAIIKVLRRGEKRLLRHLYAASTNGEDKLRLQLFNLIEEGSTHSDDEAALILGNSSSKSAFSHLKSRLREDILNVLLTQETSKRIPQANHAAAFECRKKLTQSYVLIARGAFTEGIEILRNTKIQAIKYELVAELILIEQLIRGMVHLIKDVKQLNELNESINRNMEVWKDIVRSEEISLVMTLPHLYKESQDVEEGNLSAYRIDELRELYRNSGSARVGFWYYLAFIEHANRNKMFSVAIEAGLEFTELVRNNPSIWSKNNMAGANQMLGTAYLSTRNYTLAARQFELADQNFPVAGNNRLANMEMLFRAQFGMGLFEDALNTVESALCHPRIRSKPVTMPRWHYFHACTLLASADAARALQKLNQEGYLAKQQDEWNVWFRILEIMAMIEQRDEEWIDFKIQTLRKLLSRYRKLATPRVRSAIDVLSAILRKRLSFDDLGNKVEVALGCSLREEPGYEWDPEGAEVMRLDQWVQSKRERESQLRKV
jgi:tetratricopeptide (TPR) repeat protein